MLIDVHILELSKPYGSWNSHIAFSSHFLQSQTRAACWPKSLSTHMKCLWASVLHWPYCSQRYAGSPLLPIAWRTEGTHSCFKLSYFLGVLWVQLLCKTPMRRLRCLERYTSQRFFIGVSFDSQVLMKLPIQAILEFTLGSPWPAREISAGISLRPASELWMGSFWPSFLTQRFITYYHSAALKRPHSLLTHIAQYRQPFVDKKQKTQCVYELYKHMYVYVKKTRL